MRVVKTILFFLFFIPGCVAYAQLSSDLVLKPEKEAMYRPYLAARHGGFEGLDKLKQENKFQYLREMWYFSESFYIKRNHLAEGVELNEQIIDVTRFEQQRKANEEAILVLPGFKDALVLKPLNTLIYKPVYN